MTGTLTGSLTESSLLAHANWVRVLARHLVRDPHEAEDLAQETVVAALENPPRRMENLRGWFATVLKNQKRQADRSDTRRRHRERAVSRPEVNAEMDPDDVLSRAAHHGELVDVLLKLDEPFRRTILLRYFDDLPVREVARRTQVPVGTVNSRLHRGLERLRRDLDRRHGGDRREWKAAIAILAVEHGTWNLSTTTAGAILMSSKSKITSFALLALLGLGGGYWYIQGDESSEDSTETSSNPDRQTGSGSTGGSGGIGGIEGGPRRTRLASPTPRGGRSTPAIEMRQIQGQVLDLSAQPVVDAAIAMGNQRKNTLCRSDSTGRFLARVPKEHQTFALVATNPKLVTVRPAWINPGDSTPPTLIVSPRTTIAGRVVDPNGSPIPNAALSIGFADELAQAFHTVLDSASERTWDAQTDSQGRFLFSDAPASTLAQIQTSAEGFRPDERRMVDYRDDRMEIVLQPIVISDDVLEGHVVNHRGIPVEGAFVTLGRQAWTKSGVRGRFKLALEHAAGDKIVAVKQGLLPGELLAEPDRKGRDRWPSYAIVRLGTEPLTISGRVVDADGKSVPGSRVWISDPTMLGVVEGGVAQVENLMAGAQTMASVAKAKAELGDRMNPLKFISNVKNTFWSYVDTDDGGNFRIEGLLQRSYSLTVMDPKTLVRSDHGPYEAGRNGITIKVSGSGVHPIVDGQLISGAGNPVAGVMVVAGTYVAEASLGFGEVNAVGNVSRRQVNGVIRSEVQRFVFSKATRTDAEGRFRLRSVPEDDVFLLFRGNGIVAMNYELPHKADVKRLKVTCQVRAHFRIELADPATADSFQVLDGNDRMIAIYEIKGYQDSSRGTRQIHGGKSRVYSASDEAVAIRLLKAGEVVEEVPISLRPGKVVVVR